MKNKIIELVKYGFWGGITTCLNLILFYLLDSMNIMHYLVANGISYAIAVVVNYICNKLFVFNAPDQTARGKRELTVQFIKFIVMRLVSLLIDSVLFYIVVDLLGAPKLPGRVVLSALIIMGTFVFSKLFIFKGNTKGLPPHQ